MHQRIRRKLDVFQMTNNWQDEKLEQKLNQIHDLQYWTDKAEVMSRKAALITSSKLLIIDKPEVIGKCSTDNRC